MAAEQHAVPLAKRADKVTDVAYSGTALENGKLHLGVAVPAPAHALRGHAASSSFKRLQGACITLPTQQAEAFIGSEANVFEQDGHYSEIIAQNHALSSVVRRSGQFLIRSGEIRHCFMATIASHEHTFFLL